MKPEQVFIGDIKKCTKYKTYTTITSSIYNGDKCIEDESFGYIETDSVIYKKNAILIKIKNGGYVDLEKLNSILDYIKIYKSITKEGYELGGLMMPTHEYSEGSLFVDKKSLKQYYTQKKPTVHQLKKQLKKNK